MKKTVFILSLVFGSIVCHAKDLSGTWSGLLNINGYEMKVNFNLKNTGENYETTMNFSSAKGMNMTTTSTVFSDSILTINAENTNIRYQGKLMKNYVFKGIFTQGDKAYALELTNPEISVSKPVASSVSKQKTYSYYVEEVTLKNNVSASLVMPVKKGKSKAVVIECDFKYLNEEETIKLKNYMVEISEHLSLKGFAVLYSTSCNSSELGILYLKSLPEINKQKISVLQISDKEIIATYVNEAKNQTVSKEIARMNNKSEVFNNLTNWLNKSV